jgi:hypothetical protein
LVVAAVRRAELLDTLEDRICNRDVRMPRDAGPTARQAGEMNEIEAFAVAESPQIGSNAFDWNLRLQRYERLDAE